MLWLYWRICFGAARTPEAATMVDLSAREWWLLAPIAVGVMWMGIYPESFLRPMRADVGRIVERVEHSRPVSDSQPTSGAAQIHQLAGVAR
jgi:NADH-quinone oxidoreductase subunit M